jgi:hypothetical protein
MSTRKHSLLDTILARVSLGSVPVDGMYWADARGEWQTTARQPIDTLGAYEPGFAKRPARQSRKPG